jgi:hypothetical protein
MTHGTIDAQTSVGTSASGRAARARGPPAGAPGGARPDAPALAHVNPALTLDGWYAHHQFFSIDRHALRALPDAERAAAGADAVATLEALATPSEAGGARRRCSSAPVRT